MLYNNTYYVKFEKYYYKSKRRGNKYLSQVVDSYITG